MTTDDPVDDDTAAKRVQIVVRVPADVLAAIQADAAENERTVAQTVRWALRLYLDPEFYRT